MIPAMIGGAIFVLFMAFTFGRQERKRIGIIEYDYEAAVQPAATVEDDYLKRPKLIIFNYALTIVLLVALIMELLPPVTLFMLGFAIAITVNYPKLKDQKNVLRIMLTMHYLLFRWFLQLGSLQAFFQVHRW